MLQIGVSVVILSDCYVLWYHCIEIMQGPKSKQTKALSYVCPLQSCPVDL